MTAEVEVNTATKIRCDPKIFRYRDNRFFPVGCGIETLGHVQKVNTQDVHALFGLGFDRNATSQRQIHGCEALLAIQYKCSGYRRRIDVHALKQAGLERNATRFKKHNSPNGVRQ